MSNPEGRDKSAERRGSGKTRSCKRSCVFERPPPYQLTIAVTGSAVRRPFAPEGHRILPAAPQIGKFGVSGTAAAGAAGEGRSSTSLPRKTLVTNPIASLCKGTWSPASALSKISRERYSPPFCLLINGSQHCHLCSAQVFPTGFGCVISD